MSPQRYLMRMERWYKVRQNKLIQFYITNMCNSHCSTCGIWKNKERQDLDPIVIEDTVRAFPYADYVIGGGEAILHTRIADVLSALKYYNVNYTLLSNCIALSKLKQLVQAYDVPAVTVSFDGQVHDVTRGAAKNTQNIIYFAKWCKDRDIKFKVSYTLSTFNEDLFRSDMELIKDVLGQEQIYFCLAQCMDLLETDESGYFVTKKLDQVVDCEMITKKDRAAVKAAAGLGPKAVCSSQNNVHTVYSNGDLVRCQSFMSKEVIGNLNGKSVNEIRRMIESIDNIGCPYDGQCNLLCQRRYDYE